MVGIENAGEGLQVIKISYSQYNAELVNFYSITYSKQKRTIPVGAGSFGEIFQSLTFVALVLAKFITSSFLLYLFYLPIIKIISPQFGSVISNQNKCSFQTNYPCANIKKCPIRFASAVKPYWTC